MFYKNAKRLQLSSESVFFRCSKKVKHQQRLICAVKGSSVIFLCSFQNPDNQTVRVLWGHLQPATLKARLISSSLRTLFTRFQYIGNTYHNCSLKIHQVECSDVGKYFVRFNTRSNRPHEENAPVLKVVGKFLLLLLLFFK